MSTIYWPTLNPEVTEEAGTRSGTHAGADLAADLGDPVIAAFDGTVVYVGGDGAKGYIDTPFGRVWANGEALMVEVQRADGLISRVVHLSSACVTPGDWVHGGQVVGGAGSTGFSTGVHVHWELRWDRALVGGQWVNPRALDPVAYSPLPPEPEPFQGEDEMSKPMIAQKLDGGPMNTLGVLIEPDGTVTGLDLHQWEFWRDRVGCVPVECKNPGHWEYLMGVMDTRRKRSGVKLSQSDLDRITGSIRDALEDASQVTAREVAEVLQITVKPQ